MALNNQERAERMNSLTKDLVEYITKNILNSFEGENFENTFEDINKIILSAAAFHISILLNCIKKEVNCSNEELKLFMIPAVKFLKDNILIGINITGEENEV